jgi:DNA ligase (NAD+)
MTRKLTPSEIAEANELIAKIPVWERAYYKGTPLVTDQIYNGAEMRLEELLPGHPVLSMVGDEGEEDDSFPKFRYVEYGNDKMLSLDKVYSSEEVTQFVSGRRDVRMVKLDGLSLCADYVDGKLHKAYTRGNGLIGDIVTKNFYFVEGSIPTTLPNVKKFNVRGEVCMAKADFEELNKSAIAEGREPFSNPRNAAAGSLKQKDAWETSKRKLQFLAYFLKIDGYRFKSKTEMLMALEKMGFKTPRLKHPETLKDIPRCIEFVTEIREKLPIEIDGIVFALDDMDIRESLGETRHHPKYEMAYKFQSDSGRTSLLSIEWDITRTRRIVPVGIIEPIELAGACCSRVTLHNAKWVYEKRILIGEEIVVERSGDVIPHFLETVRPTKDIPLAEVAKQIPLSCPACQSPVSRIGVDICCSNIKCPGSALKLVNHYVSKPVVNIQDIGDKLVEQLITAGFVRTPADLFTVTRDQLMTLDRMGEKKADKIIASINSAREQSVKTFLLSLGIESLGHDVSEKIEDYIDLETMQPTCDLTTLSGIAATTADSVIQGLRESKPLADALMQQIAVTRSKRTVVDILNGQSFCVSGKVEFVFDGVQYTDRGAIQELIKTRGGKVVSSVSKSLNFLVAGPGSGDKSVKANGYGIPILDGDALSKMME